MINIKNLNKYYNKSRSNEIHVINDLTLDLPDTGLVAIFGRSGCGKTTLLNTIGGLDKFHSGSITIDGKNILKKTDNLRNEEIGYIFQNYNLNNNESNFDNVSDALKLCGIKDKEEIHTRVMAALKSVGMDKYAKRMPNTLSGGQMQRIAIARAIVKNPKIILADEPTGNLDEANTHIILELLKNIAKDHLVLLVTHEESIVENYCNSIIVLNDGQLMTIKENNANDDYHRRNKNNIYLGELEKDEFSKDNLDVTMYGKLPNSLNLQVVSSNGKIYLKINSDNIYVVDEKSEVKFIDSTFEEEKKDELEKVNEIFNLEPIKGKKYGSLFDFNSSVVSGYVTNFATKKKKSNKLLRFILMLFAFIFVFNVATLGTSFKTLIDANNSYNHNVFYMNLRDESKKNALLNDYNDHGIDSVYIVNNYIDSDMTLRFATSIFTSSKQNNNYLNISSLVASGVFLPNTLAKEKTLVAGRNTNLNYESIIITTKVADAILKDSDIKYIRTYKDLIGLVCDNYYVFNKKLVITGIVRSDETSIYLTNEALNCFKLSYNSGYYYVDNMVVNDNMGISDNEVAVLVNFNYSNYQVGNNYTYTTQSTSFKIKKVYFSSSIKYDEWIYANYPRIDSDIKQDIQTNHPEVIEGSDEWNELYAELYNSHFEEFTADIEYVNNNYDLGGGELVIFSKNGFNSFVNSLNIDYENAYAVIHANDVDKAENYLSSLFTDKSKHYGMRTFITPNIIRAEKYSLIKGEFISNVIGIAIVLLLLSVCVFFIMRSSLMSRIREIGIYRAIGVTKKNVLFKFFVESLVLTTLTVFIGYLLSSILMARWSNISIMSGVIYYPLWLALINFVVIYVVCSISAIIPVIMLLRKTPSQILAKYDI